MVYLSTLNIFPISLNDLPLVYSSIIEVVGKSLNVF